MASTEPNKHGLSRYIPADVRREVRQRCGFGCVRCGNPIIQYEHFDPPYNEAKEHNSEGITLLCGSCHDKKTRGLISVESIRSFNSQPKSLEVGFNREVFDITSSNQVIKFSGTNYIGVKTIIGIMGTEILSVSPPELPGAPIRISALFYDSDGLEILRIIDNEWFSNLNSWDIEVVGPVITIKRKEGDIALQIKTFPPDTIEIQRIAMFYKDTKIVGEGEDITVFSPQGGRMTFKVGSFFGNGNSVALAVTPDQVIYGYAGSFEDLNSKGH